MTQNLPIIIDTQQKGNQLTFQLDIPKELVYFQGHFDGFPILPGVIQIGWAIELASVYGHNLIFQGMEKVKFTRPIRPNERLTLELILHQDLGQLMFRYFNSLQQFSSGRIRIDSKHV